MTEKYSGRKIILPALVAAAVSLFLIPGCQVSERKDTQDKSAGSNKRTVEDSTAYRYPEGIDSIGRFDLAPGYDPEITGDDIVRIALVIDDFGNQWDTVPVQGFLHLDIPVTIAVIPGQWASKRTAKRAAELGKEVIIHLPMEPDHPDPHVELKTLHRGMTPDEVKLFLDQSVQSVPGALGLNNHMGSGATVDRDLMSKLARECKFRGLWILDSITHHKSVLYAEAVRAGVPAIKRDIFLDHENDPDSIRCELYRAVRIARYWSRPVVVIGHARPVTWAVMAEEMPRLRDKGVEWIPLSKALKRIDVMMAKEE